MNTTITNRIIGSDEDVLNFPAYQGLDFYPSYVNSNWKIKVNGVNYSGEKMNTLVGVSGLVKLIGVELTNTLLKRAENGNGDKTECHLRRGLRIIFYVH